MAIGLLVSGICSQCWVSVTHGTGCGTARLSPLGLNLNSREGGREGERGGMEGGMGWREGGRKSGRRGMEGGREGGRDMHSVGHEQYTEERTTI